MGTGSGGKDVKGYWFGWQGIWGWVLRVLRVSRGTELGVKVVKGFRVGLQGVLVLVVCVQYYWVKWQGCQGVLGQAARVIGSGDKKVIGY